MVKFIPVKPDDVPNYRDSHRGRVSYPILKDFLETNLPLAKMDRTGITRSVQSLCVGLGQYIDRHQLPIKLFTRRGEIYLVRLDLDDEGNTIEDWQERAVAEKAAAAAERNRVAGQPSTPIQESADDAPFIDADEVSRQADRM